MLKNEKITELENKLIKSNVELLQSPDKDTIYRDDNKHLLVLLSQDGLADSPYMENDNLWKIISSDGYYGIDHSILLLSELASITGANDDYVYDYLFDKPFSKAKKYFDNLGYIVLPIDIREDLYDVNFYIENDNVNLDEITTFAIVSKKELKLSYGFQRISKKLMENALNCLKGELENQSQWCSGQVYTITVYDTLENEILGDLSSIYLSEKLDEKIEYLYDCAINYSTNFDVKFDEFKKYYLENL